MSRIKKRIELLGYVVEAALSYVRIYVHCHFQAGVSEKPLRDLNVNAGIVQHGGIRMSQLVRCYLYFKAFAIFIPEGLETPESYIIKHSTCFVFGYLLPESFNKRDRSFACVGFRAVDKARLVGLEYYLFIYIDCSLFEIKVLICQRKRFPAPAACI